MQQEQPSSHTGGGNVKWVIGAVLVPLLAACIGAGVFQVTDGCLPFLCGSRTPDGETDTDGTRSADVFLSRTAGPGGSRVNVSGEGFQPDEQVVIRFHTEEVGRTRTNDGGRFTNVTVTIPQSFSQFAPRTFDIVATGDSSLRSARTPFTLSG